MQERLNRRSLPNPTTGIPKRLKNLKRSLADTARNRITYTIAGKTLISFLYNLVNKTKHSSSFEINEIRVKIRVFSVLNSNL